MNTRNVSIRKAQGVKATTAEKVPYQKVSSQEVFPFGFLSKGVFRGKRIYIVCDSFQLN